MRGIRRVIVHHSASPRSTTVADIDAWHRDRGFARIGYNFVILGDGTLVPGRGAAAVGAHAKGHNADSIGICVVGDNTKREHAWSEAQWTTLESLLDILRGAAPKVELLRHCDVNPATECPGTSLHRGG